MNLNMLGPATALSLSGQSLDRIALDGENATKQDHWDMGERIRAVRTGPDGAPWLLAPTPKK